MFKNIAIALDESPESGRALFTAIDLAAALGGVLSSITVQENLPSYTAFAAAAEPSALRTLSQDQSDAYGLLLERAVSEAREKGVKLSTHLLEGHQIDAIADFVRHQNIDLLVIGLHRHSLRMSSLWSKVYALAQDLPCSMLGVH